MKKIIRDYNQKYFITTGQVIEWMCLTLFIFLIFPVSVFAQVLITEIMYDPEGSDASSGNEWIEVKNEGAESVDLTEWVFFEANTNHGITSIEGGAELVVGTHAVISKDTTSFKNFFSTFSGPLFKASFSLGDTETLGLKSNKDAEVVSSVTYTSEWGAKNDGKSLQKSGTSWVASTPTPAGLNGSSSASTNSTSQATTTSSTTQTGATESVIIPTIYAEAPEDKIVLALADTSFTGKAYDLKKEPFKNSRFLWNFGDGITTEGQTVLHSFIYPGEYLVHLYVSSGEYTATDTLQVKVIPSSLMISDVAYEQGGSITLSNSSESRLDVSFWKIKSGLTIWQFPRDSYILPKGAIVISGIRSNLQIVPNNEVFLLYPNMDMAFKYEYRPASVAQSSLLPKNAPTAIVPRQQIVSKVPSAPTGNVSGAYAGVVQVNENASSPTGFLADGSGQQVAAASASADGGLLKWAIFLAGFLGLIIFSLFYFKDKMSSVGQAPQDDKESSSADDFDIEEELS